MKSFKVSNFRLFGSEGAEVEFKPVTVLTGANSSGKSSYIKALILFGEYLQGLTEDFRRIGEYNPVKHELDFSNPDLKLGGFSSTLNRNAKEEDGLMSFTLKVSPLITSYGDYQVTFSFNAGNKETNVLDHGFLQAISIARKDEMIMHATTNENGSLTIDYFNNNTFLADFLTFCKYCYIPYCVFEDSYDRDSGCYYEEYCDENGNFSVEKASKTALGSRLAKIQQQDIAIFSYKRIVDDLPHSAFSKYKSLFNADLLDALEKCIETNLVFYFPVLERFTGKSKEECISILQEANASCALNTILGKNADDNFQKSLNIVIKAFEESEFESFIDYFRSLENYALENVNPRTLTPGRWGESFNFIEDHILHRISVSYDSSGFNNRDEKECLFSVAYEVLSRWQWAVEEENDSTWDHASLWSKSDNYIKRSADQWTQYYHSKHVLFEAYLDFVHYLLTDCLIPSDLSRLQYYTSSFTQVQRLHSFEDRSHFVKIVKKYLQGRTYLLDHESAYKFLVGKDDKYVPDTFLNKWLQDPRLGICKSLKFELPKGLGFSIGLVHDNYVEELADAGHGITQIISILLQIESILLDSEILDIERAQRQEARNPVTAFIGFEEPEVSLHPKYQSLLADILHDAVTNYGHNIAFIVETHSEYLVRKLQAIVSGFTEDEFKDNPFVVYYFTADGGLYDLEFTTTGRFAQDFGSGFFDEAARSKYEIMKREELESHREK